MRHDQSSAFNESLFYMLGFGIYSISADNLNTLVNAFCASTKQYFISGPSFRDESYVSYRQAVNQITGISEILSYASFHYLCIILHNAQAIQTFLDLEYISLFQHFVNSRNEPATIVIHSILRINSCQAIISLSYINNFSYLGILYLSCHAPQQLHQSFLCREQQRSSMTAYFSLKHRQYRHYREGDVKMSDIISFRPAIQTAWAVKKLPTMNL